MNYINISNIRFLKVCLWFCAAFVFVVWVFSFAYIFTQRMFAWSTFCARLEHAIEPQGAFLHEQNNLFTIANVHALHYFCFTYSFPVVF